MTRGSLGGSFAREKRSRSVDVLRNGARAVGEATARGRVRHARAPRFVSHGVPARKSSRLARRGRREATRAIAEAHPAAVPDAIVPAARDRARRLEVSLPVPLARLRDADYICKMADELA